MAQRWRKILSLTASLFFAGCSHTFSPDNPLPTSYTPSVIINSDNQVLYALNPATGAKNWELSFAYLGTVPGTKYAPTPLLYNGSIYLVFVNSDTLYKINSRTGVIEQKISLFNESFSSQATPVADGKNIYLAASNGKLYAVDTNGYQQWQFYTGSALLSSPTLSGGQVYFANIAGHVFSVNESGPITTTIGGVTTTNPTWDWPGNGVTSTANFVSSPAVSGPYLFLGSVSDSNMYCIYLNNPSPTTTPPNTTALRWTFKTNGEIYSSPSIYGGQCIFGSLDFYVYCLDTSIQPFNPIAPTFVPRVIWKTLTSSQIYSSPLTYNQVVYIGSNDQNMYALNIIDGSQKWKFTSLGLIKSSPIAYNGSIFFGSYDKNIYALDSATGTQKWSVNINGTIECSPVLDNLTAKFGYNSGISGLVD